MVTGRRRRDRGKREETDGTASAQQCSRSGHSGCALGEGAGEKRVVAAATAVVSLSPCPIIIETPKFGVAFIFPGGRKGCNFRTSP